jgi:hypothetical protein
LPKVAYCPRGSAPGYAVTAGAGTIVAVEGVVITGDGSVVCDGVCGLVFIHPEHKRAMRRIPMAAEKRGNFMIPLL